MTIAAMLAGPWAITPEMLGHLCEIYRSKLRGDARDLAAIEEDLGRPLQRREQGYSIEKAVAVVPIRGVLVKRGNMLTKVSGAASLELASRDLRDALADPQAKSVLLEIDSPGGQIDGVQALAQQVYAARGVKPIAAYADGMAASGGYWLASAASSIYTNETAVLGSIGVVATHVDFSERERQAGIQTTEITAGRYKRIASAVRPLSTEGREFIQQQVDALYEVFVGEVARYRGRSVESVLEHMADGRVFIGRQALQAGLVDGIASRAQVIERLAAGQSQPHGAAAALPLASADRTLEARCTAAWQRDPALRAEFGRFEAFIAYERAVQAQR